MPGNIPTGILGNQALAFCPLHWHFYQKCIKKRQQEKTWVYNSSFVFASIPKESLQSLTNQICQFPLFPTKDSHVPSASFKEQFPCFAQLLHVVATRKALSTEPLTSPENYESIYFTPLRKATGSHQDLPQHSQVMITSVFSRSRAHYPHEPSCSPGRAEHLSILAAKTTQDNNITLLFPDMAGVHPQKHP